MKQNDHQLAREMANCIRFLSIDAIEKSNSGHPGMPMGMADVATILFSEFLKFDASNPHWIDRDRFVLSAGHGSMLIYSLLYLTGYQDINIEDIKNFRQLGAKCAGHPEYGHIEGIETTTGPLGQGIANAVGMALAEEMLAARLGRKLINHKTYCIAGDGCLMEGISQEAISIAGNLALKNLIVLWDNNSISIDGDTALTTCENMKMRFEACNWKVLKVDGHNFDEIRAALKEAQNSDRPVLIDCKTTIAYGSPNKSGSEKSHGSPLGADETKKTREALNWNHEAFVIPQDLKKKWEEAGKRSAEISKNWEADFAKFDTAKAGELKRVLNHDLPKDFDVKLNALIEKIAAEKTTQATRKSSQVALEFLTAELPELIGGSADLTGSVLTKTALTKAIDKNNFSERYIHYGIREHAMSALMNGITLHGGFLPYAGTFLVFSDYLKPGIRLSALMQLRTIYVFTHDSIGVGEDVPTHQPIEHLAMLRAIPNLNVFRPCDTKETVEAYEAALKAKSTPSAIILTRQNLPFLSPVNNPNTKKGAYVISASKSANPDAVIIATGSEVSVAIETQTKLAAKNIDARVVSMPCQEIFDAQSESYKSEILGNNSTLRVAIEAALSQGWHRYIGNDGIFIGMTGFGASGKAEDLFKHFGITSDNACEQIVKRLKK